MKTVVNISADQIMIFTNVGEMRLERNGVDLEVGKALVELDRKQAFGEVFVINGPGGFTNLRVGSLALNLLKTLKNGSLRFFELSKPELYHVAYEKGLLPRYMVLYIGQKSNVWLWDLEANALVKTMKKQDLEALEREVGTYALDMVYEEGYYDQKNQIFLSFAQEGCHFQWKGKTLSLSYEELPVKSVEKIEPNYMIAPNVG